MNDYNVYVGARYVPKFFDNSGSTEWLPGFEYEPLTIVTYLGNSYTSKVAVPTSVGEPNLNPTYWAATGSYNSQVEGYRKAVENLREDVGVVQSKITTLTSNARMLSSFSGENDTERMQNAVETGDSVWIDTDITLNTVNLTRKLQHFYGMGNTVYLAGNIISTLQWGQEYWFDGIIFDGSKGGYWLGSTEYMVNVRFTNCSFINFTHDIFTGNLQGWSFSNCYFNFNSGRVVNGTRCDAVWFNRCNVEGGNIFWSSQLSYGCSIRDCVIENLTGTAIYWKGAADCELDTIYFEGNPHNVSLDVDYCGNILMNNLHCNTTTTNPYLVEINKLSVTSSMYGIITMNNCSVSSGYIVKMPKNVKINLPIRLSMNNCVIGTSGGQLAYPLVDFNGVTPTASLIRGNMLKADVFPITGVFPENGTWYSIPETRPCYGHYTCALTIKSSGNSSQHYDGITFIEGNSFRIFGDGTTNNSYEVTIFYL